MDDSSKDTWIGAAVGIAVGVTIALLGYVVAVGEHTSYGVVIFCLLPFLTGFSIAAVVRPKGILAASIVTVGFLSALFLIMTGLEGYICVAMAAPLLAVDMALGAIAGYLLIGRSREGRLGSRSFLLLLMMPVLMAAAEHAERPLRHEQRHETFATTIHVEATPERTWDSVIHIPRLSGPKPFLLAIGLPVPTECMLVEPASGAERVCVFDQGKIVQRVTDWQPNVSLQVAITESTLPGRRWLEFIDARYELSAATTGTTVIRYSTIGSRLYPRWYWRYFEAWAVTSEHEYVLANIKQLAESQ